MPRTLPWIAAVLAALGLLIGTAPQTQRPADDTSRPTFVAARWLFGRGAPPVEVEFAIWEDGTFLRRSNLANGESELVVCQAAPGEFDAFIERVIEAGFFDVPPGGGFAPDQSHTVLQGRHNGRHASFAWAENLWPGNPVEGEFLPMWLDVRSAMLRIRPVKVEWLEDSLDEDGQFRGYIPNRPESTKWLNRSWPK